ncbi:putative ubiquitin-conjugating enzyme E2 W-B [Triplophysa tibetana]|uniref:N-terminal E2 ubiquitin-conjugating enzyme n=1 Tax=Triplophysa tibetana TaxID=1572043 RepID=A0A5A9N693_9TELE|nr:putative ubiquitin-conjugating enzyme E2 W-B [Triplophysa tibetana]
MASMQKRLQKELLALQNDPPPGMTLNEKSVQNTITQWIVDMEGASGTLYEGEKFQLLFKFSSRYPFDSPQVMFTGDNIPVHPHVYSNGHICLSILTEDWSPALSVQSVCLSIISMLSSCKEKRRPPDNSFYVRTCNKNPKKTKWWYHVGCTFEEQTDDEWKFHFKEIGNGPIVGCCGKCLDLPKKEDFDFGPGPHMFLLIFSTGCLEVLVSCAITKMCAYLGQE